MLDGLVSSGLVGPTRSRARRRFETIDGTLSVPRNGKLRLENVSGYDALVRKIEVILGSPYEGQNVTVFRVMGDGTVHSYNGFVADSTGASDFTGKRFLFDGGWGSINRNSTKTNGSGCDFQSTYHVGLSPAAGYFAQVINGANPMGVQVFNTSTSTTSYECYQVKAVTGAAYQLGSAIGSAGGTNRPIDIGHWNAGGTFTAAITVATTGIVTFADDIIVTGTVRLAAETTLTPTGTTQTMNLGDGNHQTLSLVSATGTVTFTLTVPTTTSAGTIIIKQHASAAKGITWAVSAGTIKWMGTQPTWASDPVSSVRIVSWRYDGSVMRLAATEIET